ncbi:MAG: PD-(D/E)XK nuclease family protein [Actinomycetota bacterium]|nr:PD-(D/E)XK nuclease family protein [Actinomycetota bacterium]
MITIPDIAPGERIAVSATLYVTYRSCPQQALGRLQGEYPADSIASFRGSLAHRVFARHLTSGPIAEQDVIQVCRQEIGAPEGHLNMKLAPLELNRPSKLAPILAEVGDLYDRFRSFPTDGFRDAEVSLEVDIGSDVVLRGRVDAIFDDPAGETVIIDWKTGAWLEDSEPQLEFYSLVWALDHGELPSRAEAVSVQTGERAGIEPTIEQAEATAGEIGSMVNTLRAAFRSGDDVERRAGPHCRWCPLLEGCSEGTAAVEILGAH